MSVSVDGSPWLLVLQSTLQLYSIPVDYLRSVPVDNTAEGSAATGNGGWGFLFYASGRFIKFDVLNFVSHPPLQQRSPL